jgi:hypothetical protein
MTGRGENENIDEKKRETGEALHTLYDGYIYFTYIYI